MNLKPVNQYKGIIWDWNGTMLNDTELAVKSMNNVLLKRGLPEMSIEKYKDVFAFPVREYYLLIGFDFGKEPFEIPANEFIHQYNQMVWDCSLQENTLEILSHFKNCGIRQFVLSAMQQDTLGQCLDFYRIGHFFEQVSGLDDHYANSKLETGRSMLRSLKLEPGELLLIGDTIHDFEVATELGCPCVLVSNGHQSYERLIGTGAKVIEDLSRLLH